ncbi:MAG TPA: aminoglycoside phosphotransferase family protein [Umezawaea sp.]|nr:aminoglycoside phosphotransferase family protein [Umezawaea sp.]
MSRERSEALIDVLALSRPEIRGLAPRFVQGTFHDVVVLDGAWAARFPRTPAALAEAPRRAGATRAIAELDLPFAVPHLVEDQLDRPLGEAHVVVTYVPGGPAPADLPREVVLRAIHDVLDPLESVVLEPELIAVLDEPLRFAGGRRVVEEIEEHVFPLLSDDERRQASGVLTRFEQLPPVPNRFVHGDLAPVNLRWRNGRVTGVLDWDFAHAGDPSHDAAAFGAFGWPLVREAVGGTAYERALTHAAMFPLTGAAGLLSQGESPERYLAWFRRRCAVREHPPLA